MSYWSWGRGTVPIRTAFENSLNKRVRRLSSSMGQKISRPIGFATLVVSV
jgi:hypothetical protein